MHDALFWKYVLERNTVGKDIYSQIPCILQPSAKPVVEFRQTMLGYASYPLKNSDMSKIHLGFECVYIRGHIKTFSTVKSTCTHHSIYSCFLATSVGIFQILYVAIWKHRNLKIVSEMWQSIYIFYSFIFKNNSRWC